MRVTSDSTEKLIDALLAENKALKARLEEQAATVPEAMSFKYRHPDNGDIRTVIVTRQDVIDGMDDTLFEKLTETFCECEPVGETNVVECRCDEYAEEFELVKEPAAPAPAEADRRDVDINQLLRDCARELGDWRMSFPDANTMYTDRLLARIDSALAKDKEAGND